MVVQYIATTPILDLCLELEGRTEAWVAWRWWYQERIDFIGTCKDTEAEETEDTEGQVNEEAGNESEGTTYHN